ncbi:PREDICTED: alpha-N-acetylgalactosaminidase-like isoform X2 [Papilio polytes]|uniref:alpha-N-acetylgalactosaminidase-like isoform X2 n=1 Tax=Papilio polytes TaxID=76194 RepID=UPI0006766E3B|nr:PREDICTED: alpha-N-acetylgalactosaminidase-like isoform X2 [Papilio polytes]
MNSFKVLFTLAFFVCLLERVKLLDNGLARTPPMGWMSWGYYMCGDNCLDQPHKCLDEELILSVVDTFYNDGYQEAGYEYIVIDDCWSERERDSDGRLVPDRNRFPHGMKFISDYVTYIKFGHYLNKTERPIVYSCSWPYYIEFKHNKTPDYSKVSAHCNLWRNYHDVYTSWPSVRDIVNHYKMAYSTLYQHHGPGGWNDPDMLIIGTESLTESQSRIQLSVFAMLSAPLLLSCDMTKITEYERSLLQNLDLIAIAQDPLGIMAQPYELTYFITLWVKKHLPMKGDKYHSFSFALVNLYRRNFTVSFTPGSYGLQSKDGYTVMDVFTGNYLRNITLEDSIIVTVPFEDVILYTLYAL